MEERLRAVGKKSEVPVIALVKNGKVLMGKRDYDAKTWKDVSIWTCPGGKCEEGETIEEALRREIAEETGIKNFSITAYLGDVKGASEKYLVSIFVGETSEEATNMEPHKFSAWDWFAPSEFPEDNFINPPVLEILKKHFHAA